MDCKGTRATLNARGAVIEINNIELYQGGNCMGVDSILGGNFSVQTKDFTKRTTSGATDVNQTQGLSESEKLENFKKEIWKEIDSMSWGSNISVQITNSAFEKMMVDKEFKNKMMNIIREDAHGSNMMCGGTLINIDENGYKGYSYMQDHTKEAGRAFDAHSKDKDSFYSKKCKKDELNELWERERLKKRQYQEKADDEYIPYEAEYQGEGTGSALHIYNEEGEEVLTYTQGVGWHEKETKAETGVHSALKLAYYEAYHDARKALNTGTNVEITNENVVVQSNFDMKA